METYKNLEYKEHEINIYYDEDCQSPDNWENEDAFLVYDHRDFFVERKGFSPDEIFECMQENKKTFKKWYDKESYFYFPVYAYIHSGVSLSLGRVSYPFTCRWDTSFKGFALVKRQKGTYTRDKAEKVAEGLVKEWNQYLSGEVFGWDSGIDSCWGYYGEESIPEMIKEAQNSIDYHIAKKTKEHGKRVKTWIKNHVPLEKRTSLEYC